MTSPNLPIGSSNIPQGAFTPGSLAHVLQDYSAGKYRGTVGGRFPSIVGATPAGSPLSAISPVGIITGILSEFMKVVSNSTSHDISHPADLDDLIHDFFEGLPLVGQFVDLLDAIFGTYTGNDPVLIEIKALFQFLRPDGKIDAGKLFGQLGEGMVPGLASLRSVITGALGAQSGTTVGGAKVGTFKVTAPPSESDLFTALQNIPQGNILGLPAKLAALLPKVDWSKFLTGLQSAANTGGFTALGVPEIDNALGAIGTLWGKADNAQAQASTNAAAIAALRTQISQQATPAYVGNENDMATVPRSMLWVPVIGSAGNHSHTVNTNSTSTDGAHVHPLTFAMPTYTPPGSVVHWVPIWADRRGNLARFRFIGGGNGWFNTGLSSMFYGLYSFSRSRQDGTLTKLWDSGDVQSATNVNQLQEFSADMGMTGALTVPGNLLFAAFVQNRNFLGSGRPIGAVPQGGVARSSDVLLQGSMYTASGSTLPASVTLSSLTVSTSWLPWLAVSVNPAP